MVDFAIAFLCIEAFFAAVILALLGFCWAVERVGRALEKLLC